ncbi:MAG: dihydropteroate synthase [Bacteroidota bacterium]
MQLQFKNRTLSLASPIVMGILNVTPDSFFDGGKFIDENFILSQTEKMLNEGADIIDIGGCSTRPGVQTVSEETELTRLIPAIKIIRNKFRDAIISIDTFRSDIAEKSIDAGADMINDISGGTIDNNMFDIIAKHNVPYVLMHIQGTPQTMQQNPHYENVVEEVKKYFAEKIILLKNSGVKQIIIDPGFGFGKTLEHNYSLLNNLCSFKSFGLPLLAGVSRKSMINKILGIKPEEALNGTTVINTIALLNGANILRVHDVKEAKEVIKIYKFKVWSA